MSDLYDTLGVRRDATQDDIKQAYRRQSKSMHPDNGGDRDRWNEFLHAYEVLKDKERRHRYDKTGEDDSPIAAHKVREFVKGAIQQAVTEMHPNGMSFSNDLVWENIIRKTMQSIGQSQARIEGEKAKPHQDIERAESMLERLVFKGEGEDLIAELLREQIEGYHKTIKRLQNAIDVGHEALKILAKYDYKVGFPEEGHFTKNPTTRPSREDAFARRLGLPTPGRFSEVLNWPRPRD